ncbi:MAG: helix-turn-helix domain-containing protein [Candidatus Omnitrophica bacterium]|nr:helix-turn-helix domain-containing protein [Candidatus Omnitrophota bacterium]
MAVHHFLTSVQVAKLLGISRISVYKKIKKGQIKAVRIGRNFAVSEETIREIIEHNHNKNLES